MKRAKIMLSVELDVSSPLQLRQARAELARVAAGLGKNKKRRVVDIWSRGWMEDDLESIVLGRGSDVDTIISPLLCGGPDAEA